jgi:omega-amidase
MIQMEDLTISLVQCPLHWENIEENLAAFTQRLETVAPGTTDLIVLPEMFTTGFTMNAAAVAESMDGKGFQWMRKTAAEKKCVITGSMVIKEHDAFYNRLIWMRPDGSFSQYDKRHLFRMGEEQNTYTGGSDKVILTLKGWRIRPLICYDLRFPVWSRSKNDYDCLIYVANWPEVRSYPWKQLLVARAIENQSYVIGVNRVGTDGLGMKHSGDSVVLTPKGMPFSKTLANQDSVETVTISYSEMEAFRKLFPAHLDADAFTLD